MGAHISAVPNGPIARLKLIGLDLNRNYSIIGKDGVYGAEELMYTGISIPYLQGDYQSVTWRLKSKIL